MIPVFSSCFLKAFLCFFCPDLDLNDRVLEPVDHIVIQDDLIRIAGQFKTVLAGKIKDALIASFGRPGSVFIIGADVGAGWLDVHFLFVIGSGDLDEQLRIFGKVLVFKVFDRDRLCETEKKEGADRRLSIQYKSGSKISTLLPSVLFIREVLFLDDLYRHIVPGPEPEGSRPLIQEHIHSVGCPAAGFSGQPEQLCFLRIVDHIKDEQIRMEHGRIGNDASIRIRRHADIRSVDQDIASPDGLSQHIFIRKIVKGHLASGLFV